MNIEISEVANLPSRFGDFKVKVFKEGCKEHLVIYKEPLEEVPVVRVHSGCLTGDAMGSLKCDCRDQLEHALRLASQTNGMVIYLRQEGRNIGLLNKINAYALQDRGYDTIQANHQLGFDADERTYEIVPFILKHFGIKKIKAILELIFTFSTTMHHIKEHCYLQMSLKIYQCLHIFFKGFG